MMYEIISNRFISTPNIALANKDVTNIVGLYDASKEIIGSLQKNLAKERELRQSLEHRIKATDDRKMNFLEVKTQTNFVMHISTSPPHKKMLVKLETVKPQTEKLTKSGKMTETSKIIH